MSPGDRDADTLVAGNAFGTIFTEDRFRGLVMTSEEIVTIADAVRDRPAAVAYKQYIEGRRSYIDSGRAGRGQQARRAYS